MEIGSFIELQFKKGLELYSERNCGGFGVARLNSGRAAIYHAVRVLGCDKVYLPRYQCETVRDFLIKKGIKIDYYYINEEFEPILDAAETKNAAVVLVDYFGIFSNERMRALAQKYENVIIDDSQAFFNPPIKDCMNVYSARKFIGVPDGSYAIGNGADKGISEYGKCFSSDTAGFLLMRIEYGCEGKAFLSRTKNEERIDNEDVLRMSELTYRILDGTDYKEIVEKRRSNFEFADKLFGGINELDAKAFYDEGTVPMVYPLLVRNERLLPRLIENKHFQGNWWRYLLNEVGENKFEFVLSKYMIPITIDQRYGEKELSYIKTIIDGVL